MNNNRKIYCRNDNKTIDYINEFNKKGNLIKKISYDCVGTIDYIEKFNKDGNVTKRTFYNSDETVRTAKNSSSYFKIN